MSVLILNTFSVQASIPPFNLGYLCGLLLKNGEQDVQVMDVNLDIWDHLYSAEYIETLEYRRDLFSESPIQYCKPISKRAFEALKSNVIANIDTAKNIIKGSDFYDFHKFIWAQKVFYDVSALIYYSSGTFFTSHIPSWNKIGFDFKNIAAIYEIAQNAETNPLVQIIEELIIPAIKKIAPSVILMDIMFPWDVIPALTLNMLIKKHLPSVHINYPGQGFDEFCFSRIKEQLTTDHRAFFGFDSIFVYRNDTGLIDMIRNVKHTTFANIDSLMWIKNGLVKRNEMNNKSVFDDTVMPNYEWADFIKYLIPEPVIIERLSYKCFWARCSFCSINSNKIVGTKVNIDFEVEKIKAYKKQYETHNFWFLDEGCPIDIAIQFAQKLISENIRITWSLRTRISKELSLENLLILQKSGLRELWIGLEHVNHDILERMNKTDDPLKYQDIASEIFNHATSVGIGLHFCHILGFPSETQKQRREVSHFYKRHRDSIRMKPFFCTFNAFGLMYGSEMYLNPTKYGINSIDKNKDGFYMISVPYTTEWNDETHTNANIKNLNAWTSRYLRKMTCSKLLTYFWFTMSDTPYELLFKKHYDYNPFMHRLPLKNIIAMSIRQMFQCKFTNSIERKVFNIR